MTEIAAERLASAGRLLARHHGARDGESAAEPFDAVYAAYRPLLRRIAIRKFGIPFGDVDDLVHDVFATYFANRANVHDPHAYLIGATCNAARQYRRRDHASPICNATAPCAATPADEVVDGVIRNLVIGATLQRLGEKCRDTLEGFYLRGESTAAIAARRETSANYICRLLNYCRNRARSLYRAMSMGE
ncbi:MAG TPA: sigma-70 family RNA polymerase sigma factor [Thermoanaerobaculia bacterium]|nr:sigma-70 family RNA polymerase sigma factor [Thermoanaerobaculia bacterium]